MLSEIIDRSSVPAKAIDQLSQSLIGTTTQSYFVIQLVLLGLGLTPVSSGSVEARRYLVCMLTQLHNRIYLIINEKRKVPTTPGCVFDLNWCFVVRDLRCVLLLAIFFFVFRVIVCAFRPAWTQEHQCLMMKTSKKVCPITLHIVFPLIFGEK